MIQNLIFAILFLKILFRTCNFLIFVRTFQWTSSESQSQQKLVKKITHFTTKLRSKVSLGGRLKNFFKAARCFGLVKCILQFCLGLVKCILSILIEIFGNSAICHQFHTSIYSIRMLKFPR